MRSIVWVFGFEGWEAEGGRGRGSTGYLSFWFDRILLLLSPTDLLVPELGLPSASREPFGVVLIAGYGAASAGCYELGCEGVVELATQSACSVFGHGC